MNNEILKASGESLYGENWVSPLANDLNINRKTIQRYNSGEMQVNQKIKKEIAELLSIRERKIKKIRLSIDDSFAAENARQEAIKSFLSLNTSKLTPITKVYCRLRFNNAFYKADIQLEKPEDLEGWQSHQFDEKYFVRDLVDIRKVLSKKMEDVMAVHDEYLIGSYSLETSMFDFNY